MGEPVDLQQLEDDLDVAYVAVTWVGAERVKVVNGCKTTFEAVGMLRAALVRLEEACLDQVDLEGDDDEEDDDDDDPS